MTRGGGDGGAPCDAADGRSHEPDQARIWDYFQTESHASFTGGRGRLEWIARQIRPGSRVLNVGVGAGTFEAIALARGIDVHCLDPSERAVESLRARLPLGDKARVGLAQSMPWADGWFDAVVASEVLEHLSDEVVDGALSESARVLAPGGRLIGTVPSAEDLGESLVVCPGCGLRFHRWGHQQSFDASRMRALLSRHLRVERLVARPFVTWSDLDWQGLLHAAARHAFRAVGIHGKNENLAFIAVKADGRRA